MADFVHEKRNEETIMFRDRMTTSMTGLAAGTFIACASLAAPPNDVIDTSTTTPSDERATLINQRMGLAKSTVLELNVDRERNEQLLPLIVQGVPVFIELEEHSVRSHKYQVMIDLGGGRLVEVQPGPVRTLRGQVLGIDGATVAGSMLEDGLHLRLAMPWGDELWLEPLSNRFEDANDNEYVLYDSMDVLETEHECGIGELPDALAHRLLDPNARQSPTPIGGTISVAELAVDADYEYFLSRGSSVANVEARINSIINTVNAQYETQVNIRHEVTTILVRTSSSQPYTSTDAVTLLNQFRNQWNNNHGSISRDVAHLFTGKNINGGTIGIAWVGVICNLSYGYGLSQSDFNGNYASATDLTAHELGHNWNAGHCSCPQHTMNASITSANNFHPTSTIPVISQFRNSRTCLSVGDSTPGYGACCMNGCFQTDQASCTALGGTFTGVGSACADAPCGCPSGQIQDCNGNCAPANWVGDGFCDDGSYSYNGVPIYFNCEAFNCDGGDCQCDDDPPPGGDGGISVATSDHQTASGSISGGNYTSTHALDGNYQALTEQHNGGRPQNRISSLSHTWTFNVTPGDGYSFFISAYHTPNNENDHFTFSYSTNNSNFTDMLTVTKTSPNGQYQSYVFPQNVSGTLYIRVQDTDRTPGNSSLDTVYIDHMYILSGDDNGGPGPDPDPDPPSAPTGLSAEAGNGVVNLNWNNNSENDLAGYNVYRSTSSGGTYTKLNASLLGSSSYSDTSVSNGTTYWYRVTAVSTENLESANSNTVSATPTAPPGDATTMSVASISATTVNVGQGNRIGRVNVTVLDNNGDPVAGATVTGTFTGSYNETRSGTTNSNGVATIDTVATVKGNASFTFCVTNIAHGSLSYNANGNSVTCASN
jgi:hypothetical protein